MVDCRLILDGAPTPGVFVHAARVWGTNSAGANFLSYSTCQCCDSIACIILVLWVCFRFVQSFVCFVGDMCALQLKSFYSQINSLYVFNLSFAVCYFFVLFLFYLFFVRFNFFCCVHKDCDLTVC